MPFGAKSINIREAIIAVAFYVFDKSVLYELLNAGRKSVLAHDFDSLFLSKHDVLFIPAREFTSHFDV